MNIRIIGTRGTKREKEREKGERERDKRGRFGS